MEYMFYKLIHLLAVVVFIGNILLGFFWMKIAMRTQHSKIINHSLKGIIKSEIHFTLPSVLIITASGIWMAILGHLPLLKISWLVWSIILFSSSGLVFMLFIGPLQKKMFRLTSGDNPQIDWVVLNELYFKWKLFGLVAFVMPLLAFVLKVLKI